MTDRYPEIEPFDSGIFDTGDGHHIHWEVCGNLDGKPAVVLHGGPGSGCTPGWRRYFDPERYRIVLFDQRGCGRSRPLASDPEVDLSTNTTHHLIADIEHLRTLLNIEKWIVFGASWGSTLGLAYAEQYPAHVSEVILFSVVGTTAREVEWVTRDMGRIFPEAWQRFRDALPESDREGNLAAGYARLLGDPDPAIRDQAARHWCTWEDTHVSLMPGFEPDPRYDDSEFRMIFARLVTHYWSHAAWLEDGALIRDARKLAGIPGVLVSGQMDLSGPPDFAWKVAKNWPGSEFILIGNAGHGTGMTDILISATDRFSAR